MIWAYPTLSNSICQKLDYHRLYPIFESIENISWFEESHIFYF